MPTDLGDSSSGVFFVLFLSCHTVHWVLEARIWEWFAISFSTEPHFDRTLLHDLSVLGGPAKGIAQCFIELLKAVIHVTILGSFLKLWFLFWRLWDLYFSSFLTHPFKSMNVLISTVSLKPQIFKLCFYFHLVKNSS